MVRVALVDGDTEALETLGGYIARYGRESGLLFGVSRFENAESFLARKGGSFDMVFMETELPGADGVAAARLFRGFDEAAALVFVASSPHHALRSYEVGAADYVLKPVSYALFAETLGKALRRVRTLGEDFITLNTKSGVKLIPVAAIRCVEVVGHRLYFHEISGVQDGIGNLSELEERLRSRGFARCSSSFLVNLRFVSEVRSGDAVLGDKTVAISRSRRRAFMAALAEMSV